MLAIVGPTASGKSELAVGIARRTGAEIVAVDAFTVYRGMDVGTAKPDPAVREEIRHHLVDILDPSEDASVSWFQDAARSAIAEIRARDVLPILVGGSGLYFRAVVDDLRFPPTDPDVRAEIQERYADEAEAAHAELDAIDPQAAAKIDPANLRRSVRALEVIVLTGEPFSAFAEAWERYEPIYPELEVVGVDVADTELRTRIDRRAESMVAAGLLEEAERLRSRYQRLSATARQAIGYAEAFAVLDGDLDPADLAPEVARRTWRYAKRQRSWFGKDPRIRWLTPDEIRARFLEDDH